MRGVTADDDETDGPFVDFFPHTGVDGTHHDALMLGWYVEGFAEGFHNRDGVTLLCVLFFNVRKSQTLSYL